MSSLRHNSIVPNHLCNNFRSAKLTVHENGIDTPIDVVKILSFDIAKGKLLVTPIAGICEKKEFMYWNGIWHLMFPDPLTDRPVFSTRVVYDLRLSPSQ